MEGVEILMEMPVEKNRICLVKSGTRVPKISLELWIKTRRRKSPWDRCRVGVVTIGGIHFLSAINKRVASHMIRIRNLMPEFEPMAAVAAINFS